MINTNLKETSEKEAYLRGASGIVNGAGEENSPLAIDDDGLSVVGHATVGELRT